MPKETCSLSGEMTIVLNKDRAQACDSTAHVFAQVIRVVFNDGTTIIGPTAEDGVAAQKNGDIGKVQLQGNKKF